MIRLYGKLADQFGAEHNVNVDNGMQAILYLTRIDGFKDVIKEGYYVVHNANAKINQDTLGDDLMIPGNDISIRPAVVAAGGGGAGNVIAGGALIALGTIAGPAAPFLYSAGASLALGGLSMMLAPGIDGKEEPDIRSNLFSNLQTTVEQGQVVPIVYGTRVRVPGRPISAGVAAEER